MGHRIVQRWQHEGAGASIHLAQLRLIANSLNDEVSFDDLEVSYSAIRYLTSPVTIPVSRVPLPTGAGRALRALLLLANARRIGGYLGE